MTFIMIIAIHVAPFHFRRVCHNKRPAKSPDGPVALGFFTERATLNEQTSSAEVKLQRYSSRFVQAGKAVSIHTTFTE